MEVKQATRESVLKGSLVGLPPQRKKAVRIFLSSTFSDMKEERNWLMTETFPTLKDYCQRKYKLEFQIVDMRWGIQDRANDDHSTPELCMREIRNCQRESLGPNFVCFLGNRYGTRYLCKFIPEEHWKTLFSNVGSKESKKMLEEWYKLDRNANPHQRILQPISSKYDVSIKAQKEQWWNDSSAMYNSLKEAAEAARNAGKMSEKDAHLFLRSVTEEELDQAGMLSDEQDENRGKCLAFIRNISNLDSIDLSANKAARYLDVDSKQLDEERQGLLADLKGKVRNNLPADNIKEYSVRWIESQSENEQTFEGQQAYLREFAEDFFNQVKTLIDSAATTEAQKYSDIYDDEVSQEALRHAKLAEERLTNFVPRQKTLDFIKTYVTGDSNQPLVVYGNSGCGKTSIMACAAREARKWLPNSSVLLRFLGTTQSSSDIEQLLHSLTAQLKRMKGNNDKDVHKRQNISFTELIEKFRRELKDYDSDCSPLVIIIDSVDQLAENIMAYNLSWLPAVLPSKVKLIISTLPNVHGIYESAKTLGIPEKHFLKVEELNEQFALNIVHEWFGKFNRKISEEQQKSLSNAFKQSGLTPLYIKLVFDIIKKCSSFDEVQSIPESVSACMDHLFTNLENTHGKVQVQLALAYLSCCPGGISETELEDVLSLDEEFLNEVYQYHLPPIRRIPPTLWVRIKNDIRDYLVERDSDGVVAQSWYHRQFTEFTDQRYGYASWTNTQHCLNILCEYYTNKWSGDTPKPFTYAQTQVKRLKVKNPPSPQTRFVVPQPTRYDLERHGFNARKIKVLGHLWTSDALKDQAFRNSSTYLMDLEFITGKFTVDSWKHIDAELMKLKGFMQEIFSGKGLSPDEEMYFTEFSYIYAVLKMYHGLIENAPLSLPAQLFACLQDKYNLFTPIPPSGKTLPNLAWFLSQLISKTGFEMCPLFPVAKSLESPGGVQIRSRVHESPGGLLSFTYKNKPTVAVQSEQIVLYTLETDGDISEQPLATPEWGHKRLKFFSLSETENYLAGCDNNFSLISLEHNRIECETHPSETVEDYELERRTTSIFRDTNFEMFKNPAVAGGGKDSLMVYESGCDYAYIYSVKMLKIVWVHPIIHEAQPQDKIYHVSMHDTKEACIKSLNFFRTKRTEFYKMELLADGSVMMEKKKELPNGFDLSKPDPDSDGDKHVKICANANMSMSIVSPTTVPSSSIVMFSSDKALEQGVWSYYRTARECEVFMLGTLRDGTNLIASLSSLEYDTWSMSRVIDIYSAPDYDSLTLSGCIIVDDQIAEVKMCLVPESDVLIVTIESEASVYFLSPQKFPDIDIRLAHKFMMSIDEVDHLISDPRGFLFAISKKDESTKIWDLAINPESCQQVERITQGAKGIIEAIVHLRAPYYHPVVLAGAGYIWDCRTNRRFSQGLAPYKLPHAVWCAPGAGKWEHIIIVACTEKIFILGVNTPSDLFGELEMEDLIDVEMEMENAFSLVLNADGKMILAASNYTKLYQFDFNMPSEKMLTCHDFITPTESKKANDEDMQVNYGEFLFADEILIVSRSEFDFSSPWNNQKHTILIFSTSDYKLVKELPGMSFKGAVYFKSCKLSVLGGEPMRIVTVGNGKDIDVVDAPLEKRYSYSTFLHSYRIAEGRYNTDSEPFLYLLSKDSELLKLDVSRYKTWWKGEGVVCLGDLQVACNPCRISQDNKYLAGVSPSQQCLRMYKVTESSVEFLGEYVFQGEIDAFSLQQEAKYATVVLTSRDVHIMKFLDPTNLRVSNEEVEWLSCIKSKRCETKEELLKDHRWITIKDFVDREMKQRDENTVHNFINGCAMPNSKPSSWKCAEPKVGSKEFRVNLYDSEDDYHEEYSSAIITPPLKIDGVPQYVSRESTNDDLKHSVPLLNIMPQGAQTTDQYTSKQTHNASSETQAEKRSEKIEEESSVTLLHKNRPQQSNSCLLL